MEHAIRKVFLHPGDFVFGEPGTHLHTVLGSCIAICLWHPMLHIGGMCHFVLPERPVGEPSSPQPDGRYAVEAMQLFDQALWLHRTGYHEYQAKIFGGANILGRQVASKEDLVGEKNTAAAMQCLMERKVNIEVAHVGECGHRRIVMDVGNGHVWVKHQADGNQDALKSQSGIV